MRCRGFLDFSVRLTTFVVSQQCSISTQGKRKLSKSKHRKNHSHRKSIVPLSFTSLQPSEKILSVTSNTKCSSKPAQESSQWRKKMESKAGSSFSDTLDEERDVANGLTASQTSCKVSSQSSRVDSDSVDGTHASKNNSREKSKQNYEKNGEFSSIKPASRLMSAYASASESTGKKGAAATPLSLFSPLVQKHRMMRRNYSSVNSSITVWNAFSQLCITSARSNSPCFNQLLQSLLFKRQSEAKKENEQEDHFLTLNVHGALPACVDGSAGSSIQVPHTPTNEEMRMESTMSGSISTLPTSSSFFSSSSLNSVPDSISITFLTDRKDVFSSSFDLPFPSGLGMEFMEEEEHTASQHAEDVTSADASISMRMNSLSSICCDGRWHEEWKSFILGRHKPLSHEKGRENTECNQSSPSKATSTEQKLAGGETSKSHPYGASSSFRSIFLSAEQCADLEESFGFPPVSKIMYKSPLSSVKAVGSPQWQQSHDLQRQVVQEMFRLLKSISFFRLVKEEYRCRYFTLMKNTRKNEEENTKAKVVTKENKDDENDADRAVPKSEKGVLGSPPDSSSTSFSICLKNILRTLQKKSSSTSNRSSLQELSSCFHQQKEENVLEQCTSVGEVEEWIDTVSQYLFSKTSDASCGTVEKDESSIDGIEKDKEKGEVDKKDITSSQNIHFFDLLYHLLYRYALTNFLILNAKNRGLCFRMSLLPSSTLPLTRQFTFSFACWYALLEYEGLRALEWRIVEDGKKRSPKGDVYFTKDVLESLSFSLSRLSSTSVSSSSFPTECVDIDFSTFLSEMRIFANACTHGLSDDIALPDVINSLLKEYQKREPSSRCRDSSRSGSTNERSKLCDGSSQEVMLANETMIMDFQRLVLSLPREKVSSSSFYVVLPYALSSQWWQYCHQIFDPLVRVPSLWMYDKAAVDNSCVKEEGNGVVVHNAATTRCLPFSEAETKVLSPLVDSCYIEIMTLKVKKEKERLRKASFHFCSSVHHGDASKTNLLHHHHISREEEGTESALTKRELHPSCANIPSLGKKEVAVLSKDYHLTSKALLASHTLVSLASAAALFTSVSLSSRVSPHSEGKISSPSGGDRAPLPHISSCISEIPSLLRWVGIQTKSIPFFWRSLLDAVHTKITSFFVCHSRQETTAPLGSVFKNIFAHRKEAELLQWDENISALIRTGAFSLRIYSGRIALQSLVSDLLSLPKRWDAIMAKKDMERTQKQDFLSKEKGNILQEDPFYFLDDEGEIKSEVKAFLLHFLNLSVCGALLCLTNQPVKEVHSRSSSNVASLSEDGNHESASSIPVDPFSSLLQAASSSRMLHSTLSKPSPSSSHEAAAQTVGISGLQEEESRGSVLPVRNGGEKDSVNDFCFQPLSPKMYDKLVARLSFAFFSCVQKLSFESWVSPNRSIESLQPGIVAGKGLFWMINHLSKVDFAILSSPSSISSSTPIANGSNKGDFSISSISERKESYPCLRKCLLSLQQHILAPKIEHEILEPFLGLHEQALSRVVPVLTVQFPVKEAAMTRNRVLKKKIYTLSDPSFLLPQWALLLARDELNEEKRIISDAKEEHIWSRHLQWTVLKEGLISIVQKRLVKLLEGCTIVGSTATKESLVAIHTEEYSSLSNSSPTESTKPFPFSFSLIELSMLEVIRSLGFPPLSIEECCVLLRLLSRMKGRQGIFVMKNKSTGAGHSGTALHAIVEMITEGVQNEKSHRSSSSGPQGTADMSGNALPAPMATEAASLPCVSDATPFVVTLYDVVVVLQSCVEEYLTLLPLACQLDAVFIGLLDVTKLPTHPLRTTFDGGSAKECIAVQKNAHHTQNSHAQLLDTAMKSLQCGEKRKEVEDEAIEGSVWPVVVSLNRFNTFVASLVLMRHAPFLLARSGGWKYGEVLQNPFETAETRAFDGAEATLLHRDKTLYFGDPHASTATFLDARILHLSDTLQRILSIVVSSIVRSIAEEQEMYSDASKVCKVGTEEKNTVQGDHLDNNPALSNSSSSSKSSSIEKKNGHLVLVSSSSDHYSSSSSCGVLQCYCLTSYLYILMKQLPPQASLLRVPSSQNSKADLLASKSKENEYVNVLSLYRTVYCILLHIASKVARNHRTERIFADELLWCLAFSARSVQDTVLNASGEREDEETRRHQWWSSSETANEAADTPLTVPALKEDGTTVAGSSPEVASNTSRHAETTAKEGGGVGKDSSSSTRTPRTLSVLFRLLPDLRHIRIPIPPVGGYRGPMVEGMNEKAAMHRQTQKVEAGMEGNDGASLLLCCQNFNAFYWPLIWSALYPQVQGLIETCSARGHVKIATNIIFGIHSLRASRAPFLKEKEFQLDTMLHRAAGVASQGNLSFVFHSPSFLHHEHQGREHTYGNDGNGLSHPMEKKISTNVPSICSLAAASTMLPSCARSCTLIAQQIRSSPASFFLNEIKRFLLVLRDWGKKVHYMDYQYQSPPPHPTDGGGGTSEDGPPFDYQRHLHKTFSPSLVHLREGKQVRSIRGTITHCIPPPQVRAAWATLARRLWNNEVQQYVENGLVSFSGTRTRVEETVLGEIIALALHTGAVLQCSDTLLFRQLLSFLLYADDNSDEPLGEKRTVSALHERISEPYSSIPERTTDSPFSLRLLSTWTLMAEACALAVEDRQEYAILLREMFLSRFQTHALLDLKDASALLPLSSTNIICKAHSSTIPPTVTQLSMFMESLGTICAADIELWDGLEKMVKIVWCVQLENAFTQDVASKAKESLLQSLKWGRRTAGFL